MVSRSRTSVSAERALPANAIDASQNQFSGFPPCYRPRGEVASLAAARGYRKWLWGLLGFILIAELSFFLWPYVHQLRGGSDVPPPRWTEGDLLALPDDEENAWHLIGRSRDLPPFNLDPSLLGADVIPSRSIETVDAALRQPRVAELLHQARAVRAKPTLASPHSVAESAGEDFLRVRAWHDWVLVSAKRDVLREPSAAADELAHLIPKWIQCANLARYGFTYFICAVEARRDLELSLELAKVLPDEDARQRLAASIREAPVLSPENVFVAEYVRAYRGLESYRLNGKKTLLRRTDWEQTLAEIDRVFLGAMAGDECEEGELTQWSYNSGGKAFAKILTTPTCAGAPRFHTVAQQVAELRSDALRALANSPDPSRAAPMTAEPL
jgi:hypothetical protein